MYSTFANKKGDQRGDLGVNVTAVKVREHDSF